MKAWAWMRSNAVLFVVLCAIALHERVPAVYPGRPVTRGR